MDDTTHARNEQAPVALATCQHHWVIEQPNGPTSLGRCKHCGERREFSNNPDSVVLPPEARASAA